MVTVHHHELHLPPVGPAVHWTEKVLEALFVTLLGPIALGLTIVAGLLVALALAALM